MKKGNALYTKAYFRSSDGHFMNDFDHEFIELEIIFHVAGKI